MLPIAKWMYEREDVEQPCKTGLPCVWTEDYHGGCGDPECCSGPTTVCEVCDRPRNYKLHEWDPPQEELDHVQVQMLEDKMRQSGIEGPGIDTMNIFMNKHELIDVYAWTKGGHSTLIGRVENFKVTKVRS